MCHLLLVRSISLMECFQRRERGLDMEKTCERDKQIQSESNPIHPAECTSFETSFVSDHRRKFVDAL